jgi:calcineurin-like phosphoesterase family protein
MKLRDDIDPARTWVVSDTHFGHENIVGYCARPEDHDLIMIDEWRAHVPDDATVLHLGDLCWKGNSYFKNVVAKRLTGARKLLILGNHDKGRYSFYRDCGFQIVKPFKIEYHDESFPTWSRSHPIVVEFDHYPAVDDGVGREEWRLHGHIHNNGYYDARSSGSHTLVPFLRNHINVSVEQTRYRPVNLGLLLDAAILGKVPA